jgi:hypothetical protein
MFNKKCIVFNLTNRVAITITDLLDIIHCSVFNLKQQEQRVAIMWFLVWNTFQENTEVVTLSD